MIRFGLCCIFRSHPVKFRRTTAAALARLPETEQKQRLARLCAENAESLFAALCFCRDHRIGAFRINSQILPLKTHPNLGYEIHDLPGSRQIVDQFKACGKFSRKHNIRTSFHPDQFVVLSSPTPDVVRRSVLELDYQAQVAEWVNADVINLHAGGVYGDKPAALARLADTINALSQPVRQRLTLENDDISYTPEDLLPLCRNLGIPLVYDVHHHRCLPDGLSIETATQKAAHTWDREPLFHLSSPKDGWESPTPRKHSDFIDINDLPMDWTEMDITVEVEAKAKEEAVIQLIQAVEKGSQATQAWQTQKTDPS
jgi:UV DNA damage endonuclease